MEREGRGIPPPLLLQREGCAQADQHGAASEPRAQVLLKVSNNTVKIAGLKAITFEVTENLLDNRPEFTVFNQPIQSEMQHTIHTKEWAWNGKYAIL